MNHTAQAQPLALPWPAWHTALSTWACRGSAEYVEVWDAQAEFLRGLGDADLLRKLSEHRHFESAALRFAVCGPNVFGQSRDVERFLQEEVEKRFAERVQRDARDLREVEEGTLHIVYPEGMF